MRIQLKLFASLREAVNLSDLSLDLPNEIKTIQQLREYLSQRGSVWADVFASHKPIRAAINHQMVDMDELLQDGAEVAFFPPVTGG